MLAIFCGETLNQFVNREMSPNITRGSLYFLVSCLVVSADCMINNTSNNSECQLWHFLKNGHCSCGVGAIQCDKRFIYIKQGTCMAWDNATSSSEIHHCLFVQKSDDICTMQDVYHIPINATGENLNHLTCGDYNRQGTYCSQY